MQALFLPRPGENAPFELREVPVPALRQGHVLVRVVAAGINPIDTKLRRSGGALLPDPAVLGADFAGRVEAVGEGVRDFARGDAVYGCGGGVAGCPGGSLSECLLVDVDLVAPMPQSLSFREAAALPLVGLTAWEGLHRAGIHAGQRVLIRGGGGGVGHVAIQLARALGAEVAAVVRNPERAPLVRTLGAQVLSPDDVRPDQWELVFDAAGTGSLDSLVAAARPAGHLVLISAEGAEQLAGAFRKALSIHYVFVVLPLITGEGRAALGEALRAIAALADSGAVRPIVDPRRFGLNDAAQAFAAVAQGDAQAKIVIDITEKEPR